MTKDASLAGPPTEELRLTAVLHALSDPVRLQIVAELAGGREIVCGALSVPVQGSTRSHHLRILREAGVTRTRAVGTRRLVSLRDDDLESRFPGVLASVLASARAAQAARAPGAAR
jgi:DNA-binding transcriptional ArsR family regulator